LSVSVKFKKSKIIIYYKKISKGIEEETFRNYKIIELQIIDTKLYFYHQIKFITAIKIMASLRRCIIKFD